MQNVTPFFGITNNKAAIRTSIGKARTEGKEKMWPREASPKELPMSIPILIGHAHFLLPTPISTHDAQNTQFQLIPVAFYYEHPWLFESLVNHVFGNV